MIKYDIKYILKYFHSEQQMQSHIFWRNLKIYIYNTMSQLY